MRNRAFKRIALAAILFFTGSVIGTIAILSSFEHWLPGNRQPIGAPSVDMDFSRDISHAPISAQAVGGIAIRGEPTEFSGADAVEDLPSEIVPDLSGLLRAADRLAQQGNISAAISLYTQISRIDPVYQQMNIRLRLAFCCELSKNYADALRGYRRIVDESADLDFVWMANLGIARIGFKQASTEQSLQILWQMFLNEAFQDASEKMQSILMLALVNANLEAISNDFSGEKRQAIQRIKQADCEIDLLDIILGLEYQATDATFTVGASNSNLQVDARQRPDAAVERTAVAGENFSLEAVDPRLVTCEISVSGAKKLTLVQQVAERLGLQLHSSDAASQLLKGRFQDVDCRDLKLELFLDALLVTEGVCWSIDQQTLSLITFSESPELRLGVTLSAIERLIRYSIFRFPELESTLVTRIDLANIEFWRENYLAAIQQYRALLREPKLKRRIATIRYNMGLAYLEIGDNGAAAEQFQQVVDNGLSESLLADAHYRLGVIYLELDRLADARRSFAYAVNSADGNRDKTQYCSAQACVYLAEQNPYSALQLMEQQSALFRASEESEAAAFLVSLARYMILGEEDDETSRLLLSSLSHADPAALPGLSGYQLMSVAYQQLGFSGEATRMLELGVEQGRAKLEEIASNHNVRIETPGTLIKMEFELANRNESAGKTDAARELFARTLRDGSSQYKIRTLLRLAGLSREERQLDQAIGLCRQAIALDTELAFKQETLALLGDILQAKGNKMSAAMCYAGLTPTFEEL